MAILTIRNVPDDLYDRLKARAAEQHRSVNGEVIECLRIALSARQPRDTEALLARARAHRRRLETRGGRLTLAEMNEARREGRA
jgi:antitoxin FitA